MIILGVILIVLVIIFLFLNYWYQFGGKATKEDKKDYLKRASNYINGKFYNENDFKIRNKKDKKNKFLSKKGIFPDDEIPIEKFKVINNPNLDILNITWFGHSSLFVQMHGMNIMIDPVFNNHVGPVSFIGSSRFGKIPVRSDDLPNLDIVVITHDHYDHLDYKTIMEIDKKVNKYIVPLGVENHLIRWKVSEEKIINMGWWEEVNINGLLIGCTPSRHFSSRNLIFDCYNTLWASWVFSDEYHKIFESGDTGFDKHFDEIFDKYGDFDLAILDCGQYDVKWKDVHMRPEEAIKVGKTLNAKVVMPIHWCAFKLAKHPWDDPIERFVRQALNEKIKYTSPKIGETITYGKNMVTDKWWNDIK